MTTAAEGRMPAATRRRRLDPPRAAVVEAVARAIAEDVLPLGDLTAALVPAATVATVAIVSRAPGVVAGRACAVETFAQIDPAMAVDWRHGRRRRRWPRGRGGRGQRAACARS